MHLIIQGRHLPITPAINSYVKNKIKKTKNHFNNIIHAHVVLESIKNKQIAEVTLTSGHHHFHNKVSTEDLYKSIDFLFDKIERQVRRYKEYQSDKFKKQKKLALHLQEINEVVDTCDIIINDIEISSKPMNNLEAALQLNINNDNYVIGYMTDFDSMKPSYLEKINSNQFNLISYDEYWEIKEIELINKNRLEINQVSTLQPPIDSIESAIDFLNHTKNKYRFFISFRTEKSMFLYKVNNSNFNLVREQLQFS